jgi:hypothetical protein
VKKHLVYVIVYFNGSFGFLCRVHSNAFSAALKPSKLLASRVVGIVQQAINYHNTLRGLSHFSNELNNPVPNQQAVHYLVQKIITDVTLLDSALLTDLVLFCNASATSLMRFLGYDPHPTQQIISTMNTTWLVKPEEHSLDEKRSLLSLPEHLIDDIMTILYTIGKFAYVYYPDYVSEAFKSDCYLEHRDPPPFRSEHGKLTTLSLFMSDF